MNDKDESLMSSYKLRVNINGFKLEDIKVTLEKRTVNDSNKIRVKVVALEREAKKFSDENKEESSKEFVKYYDISPKSYVNPKSMRYFLDPNDPLYLIVEFQSKLEENVFVNLDESCESLVEMAAKSLLNIKDIDALKHSLENPYEVNPHSNKSLAEVFSSSIIKDLNSATNKSFTPMQKSRNSAGEQIVQIEVNIPAKITGASLSANNKSLLKETEHSIVNLSDESTQPNHLFLRFEGLNLFLEANTKHENSLSFFSKQIKVPKGSITKELLFKLDSNKHLIYLELPYFGL